MDKCVVTNQQIEERLPLVWGHEIEFLKARMFVVMNNNSTVGGVSFIKFIEQFWNKIVHKEQRDRNKIVFQMLDWDNDGVLGAYDLTRSAQLVNTDSAFGREL